MSKPKTIDDWKAAAKEYWRNSDMKNFRNCNLQIELLEMKKDTENRCKVCRAITEKHIGPAYFYMICPKCGWVSPMYRNDSKQIKCDNNAEKTE